MEKEPDSMMRWIAIFTITIAIVFGYEVLFPYIKPWVASSEIFRINQPSIVGTWVSTDGTKMIFNKDRTFVSIEGNQIIQSGEIYDHENKLVQLSLTYSVDYSQDPIWLNINFTSDGETDTSLAIINFIDENTMELVTKNDESRPIARSINDVSTVFIRE